MALWQCGVRATSSPMPLGLETTMSYAVCALVVCLVPIAFLLLRWLALRH